MRAELAEALRIGQELRQLAQLRDGLVLRRDVREAQSESSSPALRAPLFVANSPGRPGRRR